MHTASSRVENSALLLSCQLKLVNVSMLLMSKREHGMQVKSQHSCGPSALALEQGVLPLELSRFFQVLFISSGIVKALKSILTIQFLIVISMYFTLLVMGIISLFRSDSYW